MSQALINHIIAFLSMLFAGLIILAWLSKKEVSVFLEKECYAEANKFRRRIRKASNPDELKKIEGDINAFCKKKKYKCIEGLEGISGEKV